MAPTLDFSNRTVYPAFADLPEADDDSTDNAPVEEDWYLLAQVKDDMTINKPTLVLSDRDGAPFAMVFEGLGRDDLDLKALGFKKGATAVVARARRTRPAEEGKRGFVQIAPGRAADARAVPGSLGRVLEIGARLASKSTGETEGADAEVCESCGKVKAGLLKCTGCGKVRYCSKVSLYQSGITQELILMQSVGLSSERVE